VNRTESRPAVFYLHPWEIDPDQPRFKTGAISRFRHYRNLHTTEHKLRTLLQEFSFGRLIDVLDFESTAATGVPALHYHW
jgi:hypothetical protein